MIEANDPKILQIVKGLNGNGNGPPPDEPTLLEKIQQRLLTTEQLRALPPPEWLIDDIIPQRGTCMVYGPPGSYKTFLAIAWAMCVAEGVSWEGDGAYTVTPGNVVYVAAEGATGIPMRVAAWEEDQNRHAGPGLLWFPEPLSLLDRGLVTTFVDAIADHQPKLLVIDTLARCTTGGDENSAKDMGIAIDHMGMIVRQLGCTVIFIHHTTKDGATYRGSSAMLGAVETAVEVTADGREVKVRCEKQKDAEAFNDIRLNVVIKGPSAILRPNLACTSTNTSRSVLTTLVQLFESTGCTTSEWQDMACDEHKLSRRAFYYAKESLVRDGFVENQGTKHAPRWFVTKLGKLNLSATSAT